MLMRRISFVVLMGMVAGCASMSDFYSGSSQSETGTTARTIVDYDDPDFHGQVLIPIEVDISGNVFVTGILEDRTEVRFLLDAKTETIRLSHRTIRRLPGTTENNQVSALACGSVKPTVAPKKKPDSSQKVVKKECLLNQVQVGSMSFPKIVASYVDDNKASDRIGISFFADLGEFTIDTQQAVLIVRPNDTYRLIPRASFLPTNDQDIVAAMQHWDTHAKMEVAMILDALAADTRPLWIPKNNDSKSDFDKAYADLLTKYLLENGKSILTVAPEGEEMLEIHYKVLLVEHETPQEEALITTTILSGPRIIFSNSRVYYLDSNNDQNYIAPPAPPAPPAIELNSFSVVGCAGEDSCG